MLKDWKSTFSGILSFLAITFTIVTTFLASYAVTAPTSEQALLAKISAGLALGTALARGWIGLITTNADAAAVAAAIQPLVPATPTIASTPTTTTVTTPAIPTAASLAATPPKS